MVPLSPAKLAISLSIMSKNMSTDVNIDKNTANTQIEEHHQHTT